jgi:aspartyl-tRNA(Asn)/glutamyl-tRNA(Gln) amidotransferase subunit A
MEMAKEISAADYLDLISRRHAMIALFVERFVGLDALIMPTTLNTPPAIAELAEDKDYIRLNGMSLRNTAVGNFLNGCSISVPMSGQGTAPTGFMVMVPWGHDERLFAVASTIEKLLAKRRG